MQRIITLIIALLGFTPLLTGQQMMKDPLLGLKVDVVYLSSDLLEGRETGKEGEKMAAQYIAQRFQELGLEPKGSGGSWFQSFDFDYKAHPHAEAAEPRTGRNVLGYLDNGAEQTVIIGAHYDHLGHGIMGSLDTGEPAIHNGADDNASGVAAMLRIAEELKNGRAKNNNYLFMAFSGEEMGLYGSKYFANNPTINLGKVNYMLNMDMVGRLNEEKVLAVNGAGTSPAWKEVIEGLSIGGIQAKTSDSGIGPSDHTSFYLKDIPVLHFMTSLHTDYHKPSDDAELVNYEGLLLVTDYILALIDELDDNGKLAFTKTKDEEEGRRAASFKVTLGVMPDYVFTGEGMRIDGVTDGRPGAKAGLESGDIIIKIGDTEVKDIYGYMEGLGNFKTGDKTTVVVKRGEEILEKEVEF
ncbi:MAG: M28 family peptidase [Lewinellaceae bacterium]|nr:M28 family peptidase [Lewinellaceae bacterium]